MNSYKDCIENHTHKLVDKPTKQDVYLREESIYISGYRECERRNKKDMENLSTQSMFLIQRNAELEEQIEKMKCCGNCTKGNCVNIGQKGKACAYWTSNELRR